MRFAFDDDALLLQSTLRDFLRGECTPERIRALWETQTGRSPELWKQLAELGVTGLLVPEAHEGMGLDETSGVLLLEECGRAALAEPIVSTAAVGAPLLASLGDPALRERWLQAVAVGDACIAVAHPVNAFTADAHVADLVLAWDGGALHALPPEAVQLTRQPVNDPSRRVFSLDWTPRPETRVADGEAGAALRDAARDRGALACAAQLVGVAEQLLDTAVAYAGQRHQFGRPIGAFQAVKHMLADVKVALEYARGPVYRAAWSLAHADPRRSLHASMAKAAAGAAALRATRTALQVHGAIGYTWEQDLHIWMRRAWSLEGAWGDTAFHRRRVAAAVLDDDVPIGPGTTFAGDE